MYRTHTFDYITEILCFLNENNINKDNIITLTNNGVHWLLIWYEPKEASDEEAERNFYGSNARISIINQSRSFAKCYEYDEPIINFNKNQFRFHFYNSPLHRSLSGVYSINDDYDVLSFYNYLEALLHKGGNE